MTETDNEFLNYWKWLSSLRGPVREVFLKNWDETGRPLNENPVRNLIIDLCKLNNGGSYENFIADAKAALVGKHAVEEALLKDFYVVFMAGAIWGTVTVQELIRQEFKNRPSTDNP